MKISNTSNNYVSHQFNRLQELAANCFSPSTGNTDSTLAPRPHTLTAVETASQISQQNKRFFARLPLIKNRSKKPEIPSLMSEIKDVDYYEWNDSRKLKEAELIFQTSEQLQTLDKELKSNTLPRKDVGLRLVNKDL